MIQRYRSLLIGTAGLACTLMAPGCQSHTTPAALPTATGNAAVSTPIAEELPAEVNGPEMTQSVPPPPQVAANPNTIQIVHHLPPVPAHVTGRHKKLTLVKYQDHYWLQDVDHHLYAAARDSGGHYYAATYLPSKGAMYPLYYDSARDDYYRASCDADHHYFRCYEDEPSYVYYYDPDPIYVRHGGHWNTDYEPVVVAPVFGATWGASIPVFAATVFVFPRWHSQWWVSAEWTSGDAAFVDISFERPYFNYYSVPSHYPFVYANTLYASNPAWRTNPVWYHHDTFVPAAFQRGSYRTFSGYCRSAAAGTLTASYYGTRAFTRGINPPANSGFAGRSVVSGPTPGAMRGTNPGSFNRLNPRGAPNQRAAAVSMTRTVEGATIRGTTSGQGMRPNVTRISNNGHVAPGRTNPISRAPAGRSNTNNGSFGGRVSHTPNGRPGMQQPSNIAHGGGRQAVRTQPGQRGFAPKPAGGMARQPERAPNGFGTIQRGGGAQKHVDNGHAAAPQRNVPAAQHGGGSFGQRPTPGGQHGGGGPQKPNDRGEHQNNGEQKHNRR